MKNKKVRRPTESIALSRISRTTNTEYHLLRIDRECYGPDETKCASKSSDILDKRLNPLSGDMEFRPRASSDPVANPDYSMEVDFSEFSEDDWSEFYDCGFSFL